MSQLCQSEVMAVGIALDADVTVAAHAIRVRIALPSLASVKISYVFTSQDEHNASFLFENVLVSSNTSANVVIFFQIAKKKEKFNGFLIHGFSEIPILSSKAFPILVRVSNNGMPVPLNDSEGGESLKLFKGSEIEEEVQRV